MIQLERPNCPSELTLKKSELTEEYKSSKKPVWKKTFITIPLQKMSNDKCCFCECKLGEEGKYMQVEHFHHKNDYEDEVVDWNNLLPICIRCNSHKRSHDTYINPIIDPTIQNPQNHIYMSKYRIKGKDGLGKLTTEVLDLNDTEEIIVPRFKVANKVLDKLEQTFEMVKTYDITTGSPIEKAKIIRKFRSLLKECGSKYPYSATVSTVILSDHLYDETKSLFSIKGIWTEELQTLEDAATKVKLDVMP
ncbi:HNH endonuclease [Psychrobacillus sp. FSL K6-2836]|uniref:HNH endonuclease n=1 Tax=Psychrobacillus sp. FSL K6-2836 TaxID=2921548 RepID=UPI0030FA8A35